MAAPCGCDGSGHCVAGDPCYPAGRRAGETWEWRDRPTVFDPSTGAWRGDGVR